VEDGNQTAASGRRVHVAAGCDENYALPLAVMLASIQANLGSEVTVVAHVLQSGLQPATRQRIAASVDSRRVEIDWIPVEPQQLAIAAGTLRSFDTVSLASYHRLLLPTLLPATLDRVIYLDCDLVVLHDLWDLWRTDVSGHCLGAVRELLEQARYAASPSGVRLYRELGLRPDLELFNAGVMLINLARWRQRLLAPRAFHYLREAGTELRWHDQEALNVVVAGDWLPLDVRWNVTLHAYREETDAALRALVEQPRVVHYNASVKPWQPHYRLSQRELFFRYADATQWSGWRPLPERHALAHRLARRLLRVRRKLAYAATRPLRRHWSTFAARREMRGSVPAIGSAIPAQTPSGEIRVFVRIVDNDPADLARATRLLNRGADRVMASIGAGHATGSVLRNAAPDRLHLFALPERARDWHLSLRRLLYRYGEGHWCLVLDQNEWLLAPHSTLPSLRDLSAYLEQYAYDALECRRLPVTTEPRTTTQRLDLTLSDPISGRLFVAPVDACATPRSATGIDCRSRIALFRYHRGLVIDRELRGIQGARMADITGLLKHVQPQSEPHPASVGLARSSPQFAAYATRRLRRPA
jgi:lipopolysaccharide biosynthesis glycosyltransferase